MHSNIGGFIMNYPNAAKGLKTMFLAQIISIAAVVIAAIPFIGIVGGIAAIVCGVFFLLGINMAGNDDEGYKKAFTYQIATIIIGVLNLFLGDVFLIGTLISIASSITSLLVIYYICTTTSKLLRTVGQDAIASTGDKVWNINKICTIISVICEIIAIIPILGTIIAGIIGFVVAIVLIVAGIMYLIFLNQSSKAL